MRVDRKKLSVIASEHRERSNPAQRFDGLLGWIATSRVALLAMTIVFTCFAAYGQTPPLKLVVSFSILSDMVHQVGGNDVQITTLVGPDSDAHVYEPSPADVKAIANADMLIVNGLGFEGWMGRLTQSAGFHGKILVASDDIMPIRLGSTIDPHAWQSIPSGKRYVANIRDALMKADPAHAAGYDKRASAYLRELGELDMWVRAQIARIPAPKRRAITSHDALGYFTQSYGVTFIAPLGLSTAGDLSAGGMARLIDQIRANQVRAVFLENMTDPRLMKQLVADGGAVIGGTLYSDALSAPGGDAPTYAAMFRHNVNVMVETMQKN